MIIDIRIDICYDTSELFNTVNLSMETTMVLFAWLVYLVSVILVAANVRIIETVWEMQVETRPSPIARLLIGVFTLPIIGLVFGLFGTLFWLLGKFFLAIGGFCLLPFASLF